MQIERVLTIKRGQLGRLVMHPPYVEQHHQHQQEEEHGTTDKDDEPCLAYHPFGACVSVCQRVKQRRVGLQAEGLRRWTLTQFREGGEADGIHVARSQGRELIGEGRGVDGGIKKSGCAVDHCKDLWKEERIHQH